MVFTNEEYTDMHLVYGEKRSNARAAQRKYAEKFSIRQHPHSLNIYNSSSTIKRNRFSGPKKGRHNDVTAEHKDVILMEVEENPEISVRDIMM
ncbi:hypothetical protein QE152_g14221 [Popillia japonica]|uniref:DUF4817 domain-containing protein n=1 Tax=Popillia japonica TaxID=7064 RepID=A0AAW1LB13_POPJA